MMAAGDVETGLQHKPVVLVEKRSSTGWMGKVFLCIFMVALCCGGALFFRYWNGRQEPQGTQGTQEPQVAARHHHYDLSYISNTTKAAIHLEGEFLPGPRPNAALRGAALCSMGLPTLTLLTLTLTLTLLILTLTLALR